MSLSTPTVQSNLLVWVPQNHPTALLEAPRRSTILSDSRGDIILLSVKILASLWSRALLMAFVQGSSSLALSSASFSPDCNTFLLMANSAQERPLEIGTGYSMDIWKLALPIILLLSCRPVFLWSSRYVRNTVQIVGFVPILMIVIVAFASHSLQSSDRPSNQRLRDHLSFCASQHRCTDNCSPFLWRRDRNSGLRRPTCHNDHAGRLYGILQHQAPADRPASRLDVVHVVLRRIHHHIAPYHDHQCKDHQLDRGLLPCYALRPDCFYVQRPGKNQRQLPAMLIRNRNQLGLDRGSGEFQRQKPCGCCAGYDIRYYRVACTRPARGGRGDLSSTDAAREWETSRGQLSASARSGLQSYRQLRHHGRPLGRCRYVESPTVMMSYTFYGSWISWLQGSNEGW